MAYCLVNRLNICGGLLSLGFGLVCLQSSQNSKSQVNSGFSYPTSEKTFKVAIIGSGVGGASAAYFTRELLTSSVSIDVFEKSEVIGGRAAVADVQGKKYEAGGSIIHDSNRYMSDFVKLGGLTKVKELETGSMRMGIYNGKHFVFSDSKWKIISMFKLFWRYGFSLITMNRFLDTVLKDFGNIYELQDNGHCFENVTDMLKEMGGQQFVDYTKKTGRDVLLERGISKKVIDELAVAVTRCNYGQGLEINGFVSSVSLAGAQSDKLWSVKGGNYQVCQQILQVAKANVFLNHKIGSIKKLVNSSERASYQLFKDNGDMLGTYNAVIVAAPLEVPSTGLKCESCSKWPRQSEQRYQNTVATFIVGNINYKTFGLSSVEDVPEVIFTTESDDLFFRSIGVQTTVNGEKYDRKTVKRPLVYKVFSTDILTKEQLSKLFTDVKTIKAVPWLAYPRYSPPEKFTSFVLDEGVFYVNAIERAASALEMSALGGRNAALLCKKYLNGHCSKNAQETLYSHSDTPVKEL